MRNGQPSRLHGYPHWETRHADEATLVLSGQQRSFHQEVPTRKGYLISTNTAALEWLTISSIWTPTPQKAWGEADDRHFILAFWNQGWNDYRPHKRHAEERVAAGDGLLVTPYWESYWKSSADRDVIAVSIPSPLLLKEAEALAGRSVPSFEPDGLLRKAGPIWRLLDRFLRLLETRVFPKPSVFLRERQRRLITAAVLTAPSNVRFREERAHNIPPLYRLRYGIGMEFMEANMTRAISLGDIAEAAGASVRGLERAFAYHHTTALQELRAMRMRAARRDLLAPEQGTSVSAVVQKYLLDPTRFAADYLATFGEQPHVTLQLGRRGRRLY